MFGLPILRRRTLDVSEQPKCSNELYGCDITEIPKLKSSFYLPKTIFNNYTLIISSDWKNIISWGSSFTHGRTGLLTNTNKPTKTNINWQKGIPKSIVDVFSCGYDNYTIFRTEDNQLYGTGNNLYYLLNKSKQIVYNNYELIANNVVDFCVASQSNTGSVHYMLYIKNDGKVYGLGSNNVGFGFSSTTQKALTSDDNKDSNYLGINNAKKVYCVTPSGASKSFILKKDGTVLACGYNFKGCLGVNSSDDIVYEFQYVKYFNGTTYETLTGVKDIITTNWVYDGGDNVALKWNGGFDYTYTASYFLTHDGSVYTCGSNKFGQLGLGLTNGESTTRNYANKTSLTGINAIYSTAGGTSILATTFDNEIYTWGNNQWGQLGLGHQNDTNIPTKIIFPNKKIRNIHGGGMYGVINGCFSVVCEDGSVYSAGFNETCALSLTIPGTINSDIGPITSFRKNDFFGPNPEQIQDPQRYPLILSGELVENDLIIKNAEIKQNKNIIIGGSSGSLPLIFSQDVYIQKGMVLSGYGIQPETKVSFVDINKNEITITKPLTASASNSLIRYDQYLKAYKVDISGYGTETVQKIITEDGTLYMSGWNQNIDNTYNFNYYIGTENVCIPIHYDAKFK
jgi:alpha-tubulin suppressor-like RCC1 family protein